MMKSLKKIMEIQAPKMIMMMEKISLIQELVLEKGKAIIREQTDMEQMHFR